MTAGKLRVGKYKNWKVQKLLIFQHHKIKNDNKQSQAPILDTIVTIVSVSVIIGIKLHPIS